MTVKPKPEQDGRGRFLPGNNGGSGRPKGARNKFGEEFVAAMADDFAEHGPAVIARVREEKPEAYLKVVASLVPRDLNIAVDDRSDWTDEQLEARIRVLNRTLKAEMPHLFEDDEDGEVLQ